MDEQAQEVEVAAKKVDLRILNQNHKKASKQLQSQLHWVSKI